RRPDQLWVGLTDTLGVEPALREVASCPGVNHDIRRSDKGPDALDVSIVSQITRDTPSPCVVVPPPERALRVCRVTHERGLAPCDMTFWRFDQKDPCAGVGEESSGERAELACELDDTQPVERSGRLGDAHIAPCSRKASISCSLRPITRVKTS